MALIKARCVRGTRYLAIPDWKTSKSMMCGNKAVG